ncbi:type IV secretion system DNA-binding domain-containing protein [Candidatus Parcubacteria bacterium]|nr:type IV secretion system DNA-binding domain-containing protein [Candidatus Parcubacteria bacterium]
MDNNEITYFGLTSFRNEKKKFGIKQDDRRRHFYTIGKTGMGKSNLMENMAIQDIQNGHGIAYVDPHGEGAEKLLDFIPEHRIKDVIFLNPADLDFPIAFNVMEKVEFKYRHLVAGGLMGVFKKVWPDVWSARMEYILNNAILALLEYPESTLLGVNRMLADPEYRKKVVDMVQDPIVKAFWVTEYARYTQRYEIEATAAIQNKVGQFVSNALIRNIIGQTESSINMRNIMDEQKILILDLSKGRIGEDNSRLLGALLITKIQLAAMSRVDIPEAERKDFYLYVDEFQNFATESFASILSEARKYRLCLIMGHQYITQMDEIVRDAVFGNVGTLAVFRVGAEDAEFLEREFTPEFTAEDLVNLGKYNIYLKLMIDGVASHPFSAQTLTPPVPLVQSNRDSIIEASRERYGVPKTIVEERIVTWMGPNQGNPVPIIESRPPRSSDDRRPSPQVAPRPVSAAPSIGPSEPTVMYDAICSNCGKAIKTIFKPEEGKPVYCKSCLKKIKRSADEAKEAKRDSHSQQGQSFAPPRPEARLQQQPQRAERSQSPLPPRQENRPQPQSQPQKETPIENVPFKMLHRKPDNPQAKKKTIDLSELKRALEATLEKEKLSKEQSEDEEGWEDAPTEENNDNPPASVEKKEEKKEEKREKSKKPAPIEHSGAAEEKPTTQDQPPEKKGIINPGEKVKL